MWTRKASTPPEVSELQGPLRPPDGKSGRRALRVLSDLTPAAIEKMGHPTTATASVVVYPRIYGRNMKALQNLAVAALLIPAVGCSGENTSGDAADRIPTSSPSPPSAPIETVTETVRAEPVCQSPDALSTRLLAESWTIVVASKGARDHSRYVIDFAAKIEELVEDFEDGGCSGTDGFAVVAELNFEASLLSLPLELSPPGPEAESKQYDAVAELGNQLFAQLDIPDAQFIPVSCTGHVETSPECTGLK